MATLQDRFTLAFAYLGAKRLPDTPRYRVFEYGGRRWYLGAAGALRVGSTRAVSVPASPATRESLLRLA